LENDQEKLKQRLIQLRKELVQLQEHNAELKSLVRECIKGFRVISDSGNSRVADVFLDVLE
tara:strand:- start:1418 stop:1600 length:183 start_codon:yes stop_codon:yes gene_type:complete